MRALQREVEGGAAAAAGAAAAPRVPGSARTLASAIGNRAFAQIARWPEPITYGFSCFASAGSLAGRFGEDLRTVEYDEETRRYNANEGRTRDDWALALYDAWGYCYIAACHTRDNPEWTTWLLGGTYDAIALTLHEAWQATGGIFVPSQDRDTTTQDRYNRAVGRDIANDHPTGDLYQLCFDAMMEGRLDLSAAGVARGRRLRRTGSPEGSAT